MGDVGKKLIAFAVYEQCTHCFRGSGTAFWAEISKVRKLLTAGHIPWPGIKDSRHNYSPSAEVLKVKWSTTGGMTGFGEANFIPHPCNCNSDSPLDYAVIEFLCHENEPPGESFKIDSSSPTIGQQVTAIGFPGSYDCKKTPSAKHTDGVVTVVGRPDIKVSGNACPGYSGGPAFKKLAGDQLDECVIGLMRGSFENENRDEEKNTFVLFGSPFFR
jgi:hypothetical protein